MRPYRSLAAGAARAGHVPALVLATLVLTLLSGLPACSGASEDGAPLGAAETSAPTAGSVAPPTPATSAPAPETLQPPGTPPDPPLSGPPADPDEPGPPTAAPPTDESTAPASEEAPTPVAETHILSYDTFDRSGAVAAAGHYAFLEDPDDTSTAVTTYEELRDGSTTALLVHKADGYGASQAALYDAVETGDLVEWRQAADCFVRYQVTAVKPDPTGTAPQKLLGVAWMTYAFAGCSGTIATSTAATLDWSALPDLGGTSLTTPIRHGPYQLVPDGWTGVIEPRTVYEPPAHNRDNPRYTQSLAEARQLPYWREPTLPAGTIFWSAESSPESGVYGYQARWGRDEQGNGVGVRISGEFQFGHGATSKAAWFYLGELLGVEETTVIAGRPAIISYGVSHPSATARISVYDPATGVTYFIAARIVHPWTVLAETRWPIAVARSLFEPPNAP